MRAVEGNLDRSLLVDGWIRGRDEADDLLCLRNAHDKNVLVRRAQLRIDQATLLKSKRRTRRGEGSGQTVILVPGACTIGMCLLDGRSGANQGAIPGERSKRVSKD